MKLLFVCREHWNRSVAAEKLVKKAKKHPARSCGLNPLCDIPISSKLIRWADKIFVMDTSMKDYMKKKFPKEKLEKKLEVLDVPDIFLRNDPHLAEILREKLKKYI